MSILDGMLPGSDPNSPNAFVSTPAQILRQQQLADAMSQQGMSTAPIASPWQGAANLVQALGGAVGDYKARQAQRLGQANSTAEFINAAGTDPGSQSINSTPGQTTPALQQTDAVNDATADGQDAGMSHDAAIVRALTAARSGQSLAPAASANSPLATALGGSPTAATAPPPQGAAAPMATYQAAIKGNESGGNYAQLGPVTSSGDRAYGAYGVMGANIPQWTQAALGKSMTPAEFLASPQAQDAVFNHQFGGYVQKYGPQDAASMWLTGRTLANGGATAKDQLGTSGQAYADKFMRGVGSAPASAAIDTATTGRTWAQVQADAAEGDAAHNNYDAIPSPAAGAGTPVVPGGPQGAGAVTSAPAPSQADLGQLGAAMQPWASRTPSSFGGDHLSANAAEVTNAPDPRLALASALSANLPPAGRAAPSAALVTALGGMPQPAPPVAQPAPTIAPPVAGAPAATLSASAIPAATTLEATPNAPAGFHPDVAGLLQVLSDPWASPAQQQVAQQLLSAQMPTPPTFGVIGKDVAGNEQYGWITPKTQTVTPAGPNAIAGAGGALPPLTGAAAAPASGASAVAAIPSVTGASANGLTPQGAAYLSQMEQSGGANAVVARNARAIINGQAPLPEANAATKPIDIAIRDAVLRAAPEFNSSTAMAKAKAVADFSNGDSPQSAGGMIRNLNTALGHLGRLSDSSQALGGADIGHGIGTALNAVGNAVPSLAGDQALKSYNADVQHFVEEATKFYQGSAGTQFDREKSLKELSPDSPPSVRNAAIAELSHLLQTKEEELQRNWHQASPGAADYPILGPEAKSAIARVQGRAPQAAPAAPVPTAAIPTLGAGDKAAYDALPPGSKYIIPDGRTLVKR